MDITYYQRVSELSHCRDLRFNYRLTVTAAQVSAVGPQSKSMGANMVIHALSY